MNNTGTRRANGEGSIYDTIQKIKRPKKLGHECEICKNCTDSEHCDIYYISYCSKAILNLGRSPQTGKEIKIAAKKVVKFKVGKKLADKVAAK